MRSDANTQIKQAFENKMVDKQYISFTFSKALNTNRINHWELIFLLLMHRMWCLMSWWLKKQRNLDPSKWGLTFAFCIKGAYAVKRTEKEEWVVVTPLQVYTTSFQPGHIVHIKSCHTFNSLIYISLQAT